MVVIEGAWRVESYVRKGEATTLDGVLLLTAGRWSTLYFIPQAGARPSAQPSAQTGAHANAQPGADRHSASAEAGRYELKGDQLTFHHEFTFQGGGGREVVIDLASTTVEKCRIELTRETLKIHFPSGNIIHCRRHSE